ncbi:hypothetical protein FRB90_008481 [Tulasnella sp. 427]|nr:hypothetical protein FRB90_008481 [Tulasnella sp. 427]
MAPVIQPMIKKRLAGTSLIGAPPAISRAQAQQEAESHVTEDLRVHSVPTVTPSFPPAPPADKKTIGFSYVWHNWRRSEEGMTHGPEVEDEWRQRTRKRELQKRELGTKNPIHSTDMASSTPRTPAATQVTVAGPSRAVAKKTPQIPKAGLARILKRKRMVLSDPED